MNTDVKRKMRGDFVPASIIGLFYLLLIPTFAWIYMQFPDEFYHASVQYEPQLKNDEDKLLKGLRDAAINNAEKKFGSRSIPGIDLFDWNQINFYDLRFSDGVFSFTLLAEPQGKENRTLMPRGGLRLHFTLEYPRKSQKLKNAKMYVISEETPNKWIGNLLNIEFPIDSDFSSEFQYPESGYIVLTDEYVNNLRIWAKATQGFPSGATGNFSRMLYLSSMTITTVGYGDILPITPRARYWVTSEAVLGVVVIGLFLNAIAKKASGRS